jgi:hypothetical protein
VNHFVLQDSHSIGGSAAPPETHKLDLMAENSSLKLRLATLEREKQEAEGKVLLAQRRIDELQDRLNDRTVDATDLKSKLSVRLGPSSSPALPDRSGGLPEIHYGVTVVALSLCLQTHFVIELWIRRKP